MKISALVSLLGVAATFLPGVSAEETVSAPGISFMSDFLLPFHDNRMMPTEGVYTIWTPEDGAPSDCMKTLGPLHNDDYVDGGAGAAMLKK